MKKFYLDIGLIALLLAVMSFHFLPRVLHEVLGLIILVAFAVHLRWNFRSLRAFRSLPKFELALDLLLIVGLIAIEITGICISNHLFNGLIDLKIQRNLTIHQLHVALPFALMILIGLHLGKNLSSLRRRLSTLITLNPTVEKIIASILIGAGLIGVHMNQFADRLMMKHIFSTPATQLGGGLYLLLLIGTIALFTALGFLIDRFRKK